MTNSDYKYSLQAAREKFRIWFFEEIGVCGCGDPCSIFPLLKAGLEHFEKQENWGKHEGLGGDAVFYLLATTLDRTDAIEHGSSIRCSWLTLKGEELLSIMREYEADLLIRDKK